VGVGAGGEERLDPAGQRWQSGCLADVRADAAPRRRPARVAVSRAEAPSSLGEQNQLFIDAVHARKEGRPAEALRGLERLLQAHPSGPLTEAAMAERLTLLRDGDRAAAAVAARAYLSRFPDGFARAEAEALAAGAR
jgi:TolA-binding protein